MSLIFLLIRHYYVILFITQVSGISLHKITLLHNGSKIYGSP